MNTNADDLQLGTGIPAASVNLVIPGLVMSNLDSLNTGHVSDTTPFLGEFLTPGVALAIVDVFVKFKERGFIPKTIT